MCVIEIFDIFEYYNFNVIIMYLCMYNNVYYVFELSFKVVVFVSVNFNMFDLMFWFIEEMYKCGMEFYGWLNFYCLGMNYVGLMFVENFVSNFVNILSYNGNLILNLGLLYVRDFVFDIIVEILERYLVDVIYFDDYFYINLGVNGVISGVNIILNELD